MTVKKWENALLVFMFPNVSISISSISLFGIFVFMALYSKVQSRDMGIVEFDPFSIEARSILILSEFYSSRYALKSLNETERNSENKPAPLSGEDSEF